MPAKPKLLIFDVNETLLNMEPLKSKVNYALKSDSAFAIWFPTLLHYSLVETVLQRYRGFSEIAVATFKMVSQQFHIPLSNSEIKKILSTLKELPPHPDVREALALLKSAHFKMVALTNGDLKVAEAQLKYAGIHPYFDVVLSVESMGCYKPHPAAYKHALITMHIQAHEAMMIAAHGWDVMGAREAGLQSCFIQRNGQFPYPLADKGELSCKDILEASHILTSL